MAKKKNEDHTLVEAGKILGLSKPTMDIWIPKAGVEIKHVVNRDTGRYVQGIDDNDIEKIRKARKQPGQDTRK